MLCPSFNCYKFFTSCLSLMSFPFPPNPSCKADNLPLGQSVQPPGLCAANGAHIFSACKLHLMGLDCVASLGFVPKIRVQFMGRANFLWIFLPKKGGQPVGETCNLCRWERTLARPESVPWDERPISGGKCQPKYLLPATRLPHPLAANYCHCHLVPLSFCCHLIDSRTSAKIA